MADADFGYVGGAPGKVDLYVGKDVVKRAIPNELACDALVQLIKDNNRYVCEVKPSRVQLLNRHTAVESCDVYFFDN